MDDVDERSEFGWGRWIGGLFLALIVGGVGNVVAGLGATSSGAHPLGFLIGAIPGGILIAIAFAFRSRYRPFALGLLTGACAIAMIGGICGWSMVGVNFGR